MALTFSSKKKALINSGTTNVIRELARINFFLFLQIGHLSMEPQLILVIAPQTSTLNKKFMCTQVTIMEILIDLSAIASRINRNCYQTDTKNSMTSKNGKYSEYFCIKGPIIKCPIIRSRGVETRILSLNSMTSKLDRVNATYSHKIEVFSETIETFS